MGEADRIEMLRRELAGVAAAVGRVERLAIRCSVATVAGGLVALRVGREQEALIRNAGLEPEISPALSSLEQQIGLLRATIEDLASHAE